jgi:hypothetical protein
MSKRHELARAFSDIGGKASEARRTASGWVDVCARTMMLGEPIVPEKEEKKQRRMARTNSDDKLTRPNWPVPVYSPRTVPQCTPASLALCQCVPCLDARQIPVPYLGASRFTCQEIRPALHLGTRFCLDSAPIAEQPCGRASSITK